jgi:hypothetical protein
VEVSRGESQRLQVRVLALPQFPFYSPLRTEFLLFNPVTDEPESTLNNYLPPCKRFHTYLPPARDFVGAINFKRPERAQKEILRENQRESASFSRSVPHRLPTTRESYMSFYALRPSIIPP